MDFDKEVGRLQKIALYQKLAEKYNSAVEQLEANQEYEKRFTYHGDIYTLEEPQALHFELFCEKHVWSYSKDNYRCVCCGSWRQLEPLQLALPNDILFHIFSFVTKTNLFLCKKVRKTILQERAWDLLLKIKYNFPSQYCAPHGLVNMYFNPAHRAHGFVSYSSMRGEKGRIEMAGACNEPWAKSSIPPIKLYHFYLGTCQYFGAKHRHE